MLRRKGMMEVFVFVWISFLVCVFLREEKRYISWMIAEKIKKQKDVM